MRNGLDVDAREPGRRKLGAGFSRRRDSRAACARENTAGRRGTAPRRLRVTTSANSFSSIRSQTLNTNRPPGRRTRSASRYPSTLSGKNIAPNWQATASNERSGNGRAVASACCHCTRSTPGRCRREIEHRLIEVGRDDLGRAGQRRRQRARQNPGAGGGFENALGRPARDPRLPDRPHRARRSAARDSDHRGPGSSRRKWCRIAP